MIHTFGSASRLLALLLTSLVLLPVTGLAETPAPPPATPPAVVAPSIQAKWATELYGFVEFDVIHDTTESYNEGAGNNLIARPGTYGAGHGRTMLSVRHSRMGFRLAAPEVLQIKASALVELDFLGNQPPVTESQLFSNPAFRIRRLFMRLENPYVDVLAGQEWALFGWQTMSFPNTIGIQGLQGQVFSRTAQLRLSHVFRTSAVNVEVAAAAVRPPQRDAEYPDGQVGVRLLVNQWRAIRTGGAVGSAEDAAGLGLSGVVRRLNVPAFERAPKTAVSTLGWGVSADLLLPILSRTRDAKANALTMTASFATGAGISDLYVGLNAGLTFPALPGGGTYPANIDNGLVMFDASGKLTAVQWQSVIVGLQYYLPPAGNVWLSLNYSQLDSSNIRSLGVAANVIDRIQWASGTLFWDVIPAVRTGLEYAWTTQRYGDRVFAHNDRVQLSAYYLF